MDGKKTLNLYFDMCCQKLVVYKGTIQQEIKDTIYELFNIPLDKKIWILDEEGNPVVLSSYIPDGVSLYVQIQKSFTEKIFEESSSEETQNENFNETNKLKKSNGFGKNLYLQKHI